MRRASSAYQLRLVSRVASQFSVLLLLFITIMLSAACSSFRVKDYSLEKSGEWMGKALIKDKKNNKSGIVNIKIRAVDQEKLRLDVTSPLGAHLASVLILGDEIEFLNVEEKVLYRGPSGETALKKFLKVPIAAKDFYNILFDHKFVDKNWTCALDGKGFLKLCEDKKSGLNIAWVIREGLKRTIALDYSTASVQMNLYSFNKEIIDSEKVFQIKAPTQFNIKK